MPAPKQSKTTFETINQLIWRHLEERDWLGNQPRAYATSILLEAAELLEHYQWSDKAVGDKHALADELADVLIYCFQFAQATNIDISAAIQQKLKKAAQKYPAKAYKNKSPAAQRTAWLKAHNAYRPEP